MIDISMLAVYRMQEQSAYDKWYEVRRERSEQERRRYRVWCDAITKLQRAARVVHNKNQKGETK